MSNTYFERPKNPQKKQEDVNSTGYMKELITNVVLVLLSIAFVVNLFRAITEVADAPVSFAKSEDSFWYEISEGQYADLVAHSLRSQFTGVKETEGMKQCYAVMEYYEAASLYKVAVEKQNEEDKVKYAAIMEENLAYMSDIMYIAEDIHELFDIE